MQSPEKEKEKEKEFIFQVILLGESGVGKSSILNTYMKKDFKKDYNVTIGVEFGSKRIDFDSKTKILLQIWDSAGQESFRSIVRTFYRNKSGAFLIYSVCNRESFKYLDSWITELRENANENIVITLLGNQADRHNEREIQYEEGHEFARSRNLDLFFETSAYSGENIEQCFHEAARIIFDNYLNQQLERKSNIQKFDQPSLNIAENRGTFTRLSVKATTKNKYKEDEKDGCC